MKSQKKTAPNTAKIKRQAEILAKELKPLCKLPHTEALKIISKLNGFRDWHQAEIEMGKLDAQQEGTWLEPVDIDFGHSTIMEVVSRQEIEKQRALGNLNFTVKVKALAEIFTFFTEYAKTTEDAVAQVRAKITDDILALDKTQWKPTYIIDSTHKITEIANFDGGELVKPGVRLALGKWNDEVGVEEKPVKWPVK